MMSRPKSRSQAVGGNPPTSLSFSDVSNVGARLRTPSPVVHETPLPRNVAQTRPFDFSASAEPSSSLSPNPLDRYVASLDISASFRQDDTANEQPVLVSPVREIAIDENDIIIAVMGPTGAGKSTFVDYAVGRLNTGAGHELVSCTKNIRAVRYPHPDGERNFVLVDTPGFDDTFVSDTQILRNIAEWLKSTYKRKVMLSGLLYFHRISDNRVAGTPLRNLNMFKDLCGRDNFKNVVLVTTMWGEVFEDIGLQREQELKGDFWKVMIKLGSIIHRFHLTEKSAWEIINTITMSLPAARHPLQIQREMVDHNKPLLRTSAGKVVLRSITDMLTGFKESMKRSSKGPKSNKDIQDRAPQAPLYHHTLARMPTFSSISSHASDTSQSSGVVTDESIRTYSTSISSSAVTRSERSYRAAVESVITDLTLAQSATELGIHCLKEAVAPSLNIAHAVKAMEGTHHTLLQVAENAAQLICVIISHAQKARLAGEVKTAISSFASHMRRADEIVQNMARTHGQDILQGADFRGLSSCANSMRRACDVLWPKVLPENRPVLTRIETSLADVITTLENNRARCELD